MFSMVVSGDDGSKAVLLLWVGVGRGTKDKLGKIEKNKEKKKNLDL